MSVDYIIVMHYRIAAYTSEIASRLSTGNILKYYYYSKSQ